MSELDPHEAFSCQPNWKESSLRTRLGRRATNINRARTALALHKDGNDAQMLFPSISSVSKLLF